MAISYIIKRDGRKEIFLPSKLNGWGEWASKNLGKDIDWGEAVLHAYSTLPVETHSVDLQNSLIDFCLVKPSFAYNRMAGKLYISLLYKQLYDNNIPTIKDVFKKLVDNKLMSEVFFNSFSEQDYQSLDKVIDHKRDFNYAHYQIKQMLEKYSLSDRVNSVFFETPQFSFIRVAMRMCLNKGTGEKRIARIKRHYEQYSKGIVNIPTPYFTNSGTNRSGFASCCLHSSTDTVESLSTGDHISYMMTVGSAGQGSKIYTRPIDTPVKGGSIIHSGKINYYKTHVAMINANLQNGRGGAETQSYDCYDPEWKTIQKFKNQLTPAARQVRGLDYAMCFNKFFVEKAAKNQDIALLDFSKFEDLYEAMCDKDTSVFESLYNKYLEEGKFTVFENARDILLGALEESIDTGRHYFTNLTEINVHTPIKEYIRQSNLCVAPETLILTKNGYECISELEGQEIEVWNGEQWSKTTVIKTGENQKLLKIETDSGYTLDCTPYHKFYIFDGYGRPYKEVRAHELQTGDKLCKFELSIIEGVQELQDAYINGFYSGDGCLAGSSQRVYLYHEKRKLAHLFPGGTDWHIQEDLNRQSKSYKTLKDKFFVPTSSYTVKSRLEWFAGYLDADGCVYRNGTNEAITASSVELEFLKEVQLMLQTLGVKAKIKKLYDAGFRLLPKNDGSGELTKYWCKNSYRLLISSCDSYKLLTLGLKLHRLQIDKRKPQRDANQFIKIASVSDLGRIDDTFCLNEPLKHTAMFNGLLTGQCQEITLKTKAYKNIEELYLPKYLKDSTLSPEVLEYYKKRVDEIEGEIAICSLSAIAQGRTKTEEEYQEAAWVSLDMIHTGITESDYMIPHAEYTSKKRMSAGVGMINVAYDLAKNKLKYDTQEGRDYVHKISERHYWHLLNASLELSKEFGNAEWMHKTKWTDENSWLPLDTYNKNIDSIVTAPLQYNWEELRQRIIANGGHAFTVLVAHMPTESSASASGCTNSVYPIRDLTLKKTNETLSLSYVAPDLDKLAKYYQSAWDISVEDMAKIYGIIQKFTDQAISADVWYDVRESTVITSNKLLSAFFFFVKYGVKTRYYANSNTKKTKDEKPTDISDAPEIEADCESCKL